jgi:Mn-dependent DtxR family transcriptional regulator
MAVAETSRIAFHDHLRSGGLGRQASAIYLHVIESERDWSRRELSRALGIEPGAVAGRVNELVAAGLLAEYPKRKCRYTGRTIHPVGRIMPVQRNLFGEAA